MSAADRAALARVEERLSAIEDHQKATRCMVKELLDLLGDVLAAAAEKQRAARPRQEAAGQVRHLRIVRDE